GVKYAYLASEITYQEMMEIKEKSKISLMALVLGHPIVSHSRRHLLSSYFTNYNRKMKRDTYKIVGKNKEDVGEYYIREKDHGTSILYGNILNGTKYLNRLSNTLEYAILDEQLIDHDLFIKLLGLCQRVLNNEDVFENIKELIGEDTLFFERKTIYKVKKNEKD
ncbi:MAG: U32 family peptidase, partial [Bacilli bacterium]|nr:U32 family peptidase [Bacilli bacterium]